MRKVIRSVERAGDFVLLLFFLTLILISGYTMYDTLLIYNNANGVNLRSYRPNIVEGEGWDMSALSEDVVGWLTVDDTNIDYPVMQGRDNGEYLDKDPFGAYSLSGSIFLDARNASDFSDPYSLIYGHHMEFGRMFGALDAFMNEKFFDEHRTGTLTVSDTVCGIRFFAALEADGLVEEIFAPNETDGTMEYITAHASIWREPDEGRLIALSTCKFPETAERIIVVGVLTDE